MERFTVSMNSGDIDLFERKRADLGMSKSAFIRLLIAEHENRTPYFIQYKDIIKILSNINTKLDVIILNEKISTTDKLILDEKINTLNNTIKQMITDCAKLAQSDKRE
jgi:hypothetical protein